ncbi:RDD family protein [Leucothrix pacifica]|uniref:RDD family protein n=1 Tax=Leucothrix pacifica TaxID=1247513 RepID=A0A317C8Z2_9GAMM|nr:RDD family protein [Leucothrix pacifica]PWQ95064.1 RDD family protein [Leucothrix pacifica]
MEQIEQRWISGFWRRLGALFIDSLILGLLGFLLGLVFESTFVEMGQWGRIVGFVISVAYFGLMNSALFNGQTLGKKLLKIRVVDASNNSISLIKSLIRYVILGTPFFLNALQFTGDNSPTFLIYPIYIIVFGGLLAIPYLYCFNTMTRQSLHDLIVGSYVVNADAKKQETGAVWKGHPYIVGLLLLISASIPFVYGTLQKDVAFEELITAEDLQTARLSLMENPAVRDAFIKVIGFTGFNEAGESERSNFLSAGVFLRSDETADEAMAKDFAKIVLSTYPEAEQNSQIRLLMTYGYDIGIFSRWHNRQYSFSKQALE